MSSPPTGTVTFLFTDIQGSTKLWEHNVPAMQSALARHNQILQNVIEARGGHVFKTVGDAFCAAFPDAPSALEAALEAQRALSAEEWGDEIGLLRVRMALHTGSAEARGGDYFGPPVNRVARLLSAGHGGQTLLSLATQELVRDELPQGAELKDLGERRLKDLFRPERVFQLVDPDLPASFPTLRTLDARLNNLPVQPTPLVGREREVTEVCARLRRPDVRLLTLTGPAGTGKTRLGLQAAAERLDEFEGGAFFVALAPVSDPDLVASTIAGPLGVVESGEQPLEESLKDHLRTKELLLLLDNFEQVLEAAPLVGELLAACPRVKVLATSRTVLRVYGEHEYVVPPLGLPDPSRLPPIERLTEYEAVRLFVERAVAAKADFAVTNANAPAVAEICVRLDGLPLAIELAAARIKLLPPNAMLERLGSRLKLLRGGARDLPERQRTLRGAIEWSHDLLDEGERALFARLSVFSGGRTLEAVEAVCDAEGDLPVDVLDGVSSLLDKSLVRQEEGPEGVPRFVMLETIHEYALERLQERGEAEATRRAHAEYFLALAEESEPELKGPDQVKWLERLEVEHDNLRAALSWALGGEDSELGLRLASALSLFWEARGHFNEGVRWFEEALAKGGATASRARAGALNGLGSILRTQGILERAEACSEEALVLCEELAYPEGIANSLAQLGLIAEFRNDVARATTLLEESLTVAQQSGYQKGVPGVLMSLAWIACDGGDIDGAQQMWGEVLEMAREQGDHSGVSHSLFFMGYTELARGNQQRAEMLLEESLAISRRLGQKWIVAGCLGSLGIAATLRGDPRRAKTLIKQGLALNLELGTKSDIAEDLEGLAEVAGTLGKHLQAARLWGAAEAIREAIERFWSPAERLLHEPQLTAARSLLDEKTWETAFAEGRAMELEEAVEYAFSEDDSSMIATGTPERTSTTARPSALTRREHEVAKLVARGLTNRQIAEELVLSERTVENHVSNILKKLNLSSRSEVVAWVEEQRS
jgi:predicted ATPase/class 3 adenylate cyclase/DNA-binding CsgD family transcriptional regulator